MKKVSAVLAMLAVLLLGVVVGALGTHLFYAQKVRRAGSFSGIAIDHFAHRLERDLGLSAEQRRQIDEILEESRREGRVLREEMRPRVTGMMRRTAERIEAVLTPEQRQRFAELQRHHRGRAERFLLGPPGPGSIHHPPHPRSLSHPPGGKGKG